MGVRYETLWKHTGAGCRVRVAPTSLAWPRGIARFPACQRARPSSSRRYHTNRRLTANVWRSACRPTAAGRPPHAHAPHQRDEGPGGHVVVERVTALGHEDVLAETNRSAPVYGSFGSFWRLPPVARPPRSSATTWQRCGLKTASACTVAQQD